MQRDFAAEVENLQRMQRIYAAVPEVPVDHHGASMMKAVSCDPGPEANQDQFFKANQAGQAGQAEEVLPVSGLSSSALVPVLASVEVERWPAREGRLFAAMGGSAGDVYDFENSHHPAVLKGEVRRNEAAAKQGGCLQHDGRCWRFALLVARPSFRRGRLEI